MPRSESERHGNDCGPHLRNGSRQHVANPNSDRVSGISQSRNEQTKHRHRIRNCNAHRSERQPSRKDTDRHALYRSQAWPANRRMLPGLKRTAEAVRLQPIQKFAGLAQRLGRVLDCGACSLDASAHPGQMHKACRHQVQRLAPNNGGGPTVLASRCSDRAAHCRCEKAPTFAKKLA